MTSEIGRMLKCLKKSTYHSLQDDAYSHITLLQTGEPTSQQSDEINFPSSIKSSDNQGCNKISLKHRSLENLTEEVFIDAAANNSSETCRIRDESSLTEEQRNCTNTNCGGTDSIGKSISTSNNNSSSSGGFLSFFGIKFNGKSSIRHLDRSSPNDSLAADKNEPNNRYTKFPLKNSRSGSALVGTQSQEVFEGNKIIVAPDPSSSLSKPSAESHSQISSSSSSSAPPSNSKFEISQIQSTPETRTYSNPNRRPYPSSSSKKGTFSPSNFISKSICSFGKKSKRSSSFANKRKSKSDNNLNRVDLSSSGSSSALSILNSTINGNRGVTSSSQNIYNSEPGSEVLRLNSVQIGDHATINLPWTGIQRNNLSTPTSQRVIQNTHNNNFDSVRYVECGFKWIRDSSNLPAIRALEQTHAHLDYATSSALRQRSKSLERDAGCRINSRNSIASSSAGTLDFSHSSLDTSRRSKSKRSSNTSNWSTRETSPNANFGLHQVRRCLTPEEQEILLRNISWDCFSLTESSTPPPRPEKSASFRNKFGSSPSSKFVKSVLPRKTPHISKIPYSVPNSFSNSSDSSDNYSAPPSPPPRPPSTLKPESRLISSTKNNCFLSNKKVNCGGVVRSSSFRVPPSPHIVPIGPRSSKSDAEDVSSDTICVGTSTYRKRFEGETVSQQTLSAATTQPLSFPVSASGVPKMSVEDCRKYGFVNKPASGWVHPEKLLSTEGITYPVRGDFVWMDTGARAVSSNGGKYSGCWGFVVKKRF